VSTHIGTVTRTLHPVGPPRLAPLREPAELVMARPRMPMELALEALRGPLRPFIVWALFWGAKPFSELMRHIPEVTKKALRRELADMERIGFVCRDVRPGSNRQAEYSLSPLGGTLRPVVGAMYEWGLLCAQPRRASQERMRARSGA